MRSDGAGKVKDRMHMNSKGAHPIRLRDFIESTPDGPSRRVHKNINASKIDDDLIDTVTTGFGVSYIDLEKLYSGAILLSDRRKFGISFRGASSRGCDDMSSLSG